MKSEEFRSDELKKKIGLIYTGNTNFRQPCANAMRERSKIIIGINVS